MHFFASGGKFVVFFPLSKAKILGFFPRYRPSPPLVRVHVSTRGGQGTPVICFQNSIEQTIIKSQEFLGCNFLLSGANHGPLERVGLFIE